MNADETTTTEEAPAEEVAPSTSHKKAKVITIPAGGIERYDCSEGDFQTFEDAAAVERHIASAG